MIQNLTKLLLATAILSSNATYAMEAPVTAAHEDVGTSGLKKLYPDLTFPTLVLHKNFYTHNGLSAYSFEKQEIKPNGAVENVINPDGTAIEITQRNYRHVNAEMVYSVHSGAWGTITRPFVDEMIGVSKTVACNSHSKDISNKDILQMAKSRFNDLLERKEFDEAFMMYELVKYMLPFEDATMRNYFPNMSRVFRYVNLAKVTDDADGRGKAFTEALRQHVLARTPAHILALCKRGDVDTAETLLGKFRLFTQEDEMAKELAGLEGQIAATRTAAADKAAAEAARVAEVEALTATNANLAAQLAEALARIAASEAAAAEPLPTAASAAIDPITDAPTLASPLDASVPVASSELPAPALLSNAAPMQPANTEPARFPPAAQAEQPLPPAVQTPAATGGGIFGFLGNVLGWFQGYRS
jgi:hypothetical protein